MPRQPTKCPCTSDLRPTPKHVSISTLNLCHLPQAVQYSTIHMQVCAYTRYIFQSPVLTCSFIVHPLRVFRLGVHRSMNRLGHHFRSIMTSLSIDRLMMGLGESRSLEIHEREHISSFPLLHVAHSALTHALKTDETSYHKRRILYCDPLNICVWLSDVIWSFGAGLGTGVEFTPFSQVLLSLWDIILIVIRSLSGRFKAALF